MKSDVRSEMIRQIRMGIDPDLHQAIRHLWIAHSAAEDSRDIPGLMATLTDDCIYTVVNTGAEWHGKDGATRFYRRLLAAFPDIHFDLQHIVIGPQGVFEEAHVTGTYQEQWMDMPSPEGQAIEFEVGILFPWDSQQNLFSGERIYFLRR